MHPQQGRRLWPQKQAQLRWAGPRAGSAPPLSSPAVLLAEPCVSQPTREPGGQVRVSGQRRGRVDEQTGVWVPEGPRRSQKARGKGLEQAEALNCSPGGQ